MRLLSNYFHHLLFLWFSARHVSLWRYKTYRSIFARNVAYNTALKPNSITLVGSELVQNWFEPDTVMEFGFYQYVLVHAAVFVCSETDACWLFNWMITNDIFHGLTSFLRVLHLPPVQYGPSLSCPVFSIDADCTSRRLFNTDALDLSVRRTTQLFRCAANGHCIIYRWRLISDSRPSHSMTDIILRNKHDFESRIRD